MSATISRRSGNGGNEKVMPMQPSPSADTSRLLLPSLRVCIGLTSPLTVAAGGGSGKSVKSTCLCEYHSQMVHDELNVLSAFLAVAEERSFTPPATRLGGSASAVSHAMRGLEEGIGVRLLARTTRSVSPTEAGAQLLAHLSPALVDIRGALERISGLRDKPAGRVRLLVTPLAVHMVLAPKLGQF